MTGLHSRGYRPKPGERVMVPEYPGHTRHLWTCAWTSARRRELVFFRVERLAREALDAREQLDPLTERYAMRIARKAVAICGRLELLSTPEAANPWGPS